MDFGRVIREATPLLLQGLRYTIIVSLLGIIIGIVIGLFVCLMKMSNNKILRAIAGTYIWIIRGTPMLVQSYVVFFGFPQLIQTFVPGFRLDAFTAGVITLSLNAGAYLAEIFRSGIQAVPKGQTEAARSLGLSSTKTMMKVVLPQAFKITIPSLVNQFIISVKDTSILSAIGLAELTNMTKQYVGKSFEFFASYVYLAAYYLVFVSLLMLLSNYIEKRLKYERKSNS
ncbi:MAG: amino acid ABC transporter permease [Ruminococcus sp.]|nr:amino acid ABC transporter permease [Ruminococcus sp.]